MKESDIRNIDLLDRYAVMAAKDVERFFDKEHFVRSACPACEETGQTKEFSKNGFTYVSCPVCGTLYASPRPTQEQLDYFYSKSESNDFFASEFLAPYTEARRKKIFVPRAQDIVERFRDLGKSTSDTNTIGAGGRQESV